MLNKTEIKTVDRLLNLITENLDTLCDLRDRLKSENKNGFSPDSDRCKKLVYLSQDLTFRCQILESLARAYDEENNKEGDK